MLTPTQIHEMAVLSRPHSPAKEWATAQISEDRRQALEDLLEEVASLRQSPEPVKYYQVCFATPAPSKNEETGHKR